MTTTPTVHITDGKPMADSREIAATFGRQHKDVLRAYRELACSADFRQRNFAPFHSKDLSGSTLSHVLMTKNGFAFLVLGFTGAPAAVFKEAYIERFDAMEEALRGKAILAVPTTFAEALQLAADNQRQVEAQAAQIAVLAPRSEALATIADGEGTFCIRDAAKMLQVTESGLTAYLSGNDWIYRREPGGPWVATARRFGQGWITTKVIPVEVGNGKVWNKPQARITSAGLTVLAMRLGKPVPAGLAASAPLIEHAARPQGGH
jgi:Rha family phage regulatory protein